MLRTVLYIYLSTLCLYLVLRFSFGDSLWWLSLLNTFAPLLFVPLVAALPAAWLKRWHLGFVLTSWLGVVGLLWFGPVLSLGPRDVPEGLRLEVVTYNMRANPDGLEAWLRTLNADIVTLQEVPESYTKGAPALLEAYPHQVSQPEAWGKMVLSRYPLTEMSSVGTEKIQRIEIKIDGRSVALYNVHLRWPIGEPRFSSLPWFEVNALSRYDDTIRNQQIGLLIDSLRQESLPYVVTGDFNMSQHAATYGRVAEVMQDAFRAAGVGWGNTWPAELQSGLPVPLLLRLDYIWYSDAFDIAEVERGPKLASDHLPVRATLVLR